MFLRWKQYLTTHPCSQAAHAIFTMLSICSRPIFFNPSFLRLRLGKLLRMAQRGSLSATYLIVPCMPRGFHIRSKAMGSLCMAEGMTNDRNESSTISEAFLSWALKNKYLLSYSVSNP